MFFFQAKHPTTDRNSYNHGFFTGLISTLAVFFVVVVAIGTLSYGMITGEWSGPTQKRHSVGAAAILNEAAISSGSSIGYTMVRRATRRCSHSLPM